VDLSAIVVIVAILTAAVSVGLGIWVNRLLTRNAQLNQALQDRDALLVEADKRSSCASPSGRIALVAIDSPARLAGSTVMAMNNARTVTVIADDCSVYVVFPFALDKMIVKSQIGRWFDDNPYTLVDLRDPYDDGLFVSGVRTATRQPMGPRDIALMVDCILNDPLNEQE
jgi:hypothetical protein